MIWFDGRLVGDQEARLEVRDRGLEHGVGLFETMRAVSGRVPLLDRHLARLHRSAGVLGLSTGGTKFPEHRDVTELLTANRSEGAAVVRLTLSGGFDTLPALGWMIVRQIPSESGPEFRLEGRFELVSDDELARHKTLNHWRRRRLMEASRAEGVHERIGRTQDGRIWEAIWANVFVVREGVLMTPTLDGPILPGIMRALVLERAERLCIPTTEYDLYDLEGDEVFLTNAVRGILPVTWCDGRVLAAPGPVTGALIGEVNSWLAGGEGR